MRLQLKCYSVCGTYFVWFDYAARNVLHSCKRTAFVWMQLSVWWVQFATAGVFKSWRLVFALAFSLLKSHLWRKRKMLSTNTSIFHRAITCAVFLMHSICVCIIWYYFWSYPNESICIRYQIFEYKKWLWTMLWVNSVLC